MKKQFNKIASIAFAFALLMTLVPVGNAATEADLDLTGTVNGGVAITIDDSTTASKTLSVNPSAGYTTDQSDVDEAQTGDATTGNVLNIWNNNAAGFSVTGVLTAGDTTTDGDLYYTAGTELLSTGSGTIKFKSTDTTIGGGTPVGSYTAYSTSTTVYTGTSMSVSDQDITVDHELIAPVAVTPGSYTGQVVYTIASL